MSKVSQFLTILLAWSAIALSVQAAPKSVLWDRWTAHDSASTARIDHAPWTRLLETYMLEAGDGVDRFAYAEVTPSDRKALQTYLERLASTPISTYNRDEQLAYWINLYNALTVELILRYYPVPSITDIDISPGWFAFGPWDKKLIEIENEALSLNDIEHRILRPIWRDPRIHYAVNCASIGCPNLQPMAFTPERMERMLNRAACEYVNNPRGVDIIDDELIVSSIYEWFKEDFGDNDRGVIEHLKVYAAPELRRALDGRTRLDGHSYDWSLNDVSESAAADRTEIRQPSCKSPTEST